MEPFTLALTIAIPIAVILAALVFAAYFYLLPKYLIRKIRSGGDNVKYPDDYAEILEKIEIERDLTYDSSYPQNVYDLYRPKNGAPKGLVLWMHGGFFIAGDKKGVENVCASVAADGFLVAAINYATAPEFKYPAAVAQLDEAVKYFRSAEKETTEKGFFLAGDSAGGQIVAQYSALTASEQLQRDMNMKPCIGCAEITGSVLVCAPIDLSELRGAHKLLDRLLPVFGRVYYGRGKWYRCDKYKSANLFEYIGSGFPPAFLTDGNHISFEGQNKKLAALLDEHGVYNETLFFDPATYGEINHEYLFELDTAPAQTALELLIAFLNKRKCG